MPQSHFHQNRLPTTVHGDLHTDRLESWKEVAGYFGRDVRTVQLWEKNELLPIRRHKHNKSGTVFAYRSELRKWWNTRCGEPAAQSAPEPEETRREIVPSVHLAQKLSCESSESNIDADVDDVSHACMMGRYFWKQRGPSSLQKSLHYFNNALHLDRQCADAYAGISDCYVSLSFHNVIPTGYAMTRATEAALAALKLNGMSAACQCAYANVLLSFNWDFKEAEKASYRSIELDPCNPQSLTVCSMLFGIKGRNEEAVQLALSAVRLDPLSSTLNNALAAAYYQAGDYRQAIKVSYRTIELQPNLVMGHVRLGLSLAELGNCNAAEAVFNHVVSLCNRSPYSLALLAFAQAKLKKAAQARELLSEIHQPKYSECVPFVDLAAVYAALEQRSTAMECLTRAFERREMRAIFLRGDPRFRCLQEEAEFQRILSFLE